MSITIGIASLSERESSLLRTLASIEGQADRIFVALNGYAEIPQELRNNPKIHCDLLDNSLMDSAKFLHVSECDGWYFGCDDDLQYPDGYVSYMISKTTQYNSIVSLHGRKYNRPVTSFKRNFKLNYHCLHSYDYDTELDLGGTGVMCFDTNRFKLSIADFLIHGMADVWVSKKAHEQGVPIMGVAHKSNYLHYTPPQNNQTLWNFFKTDSVQTGILQSFLK
jgi:hypothetical protein